MRYTGRAMRALHCLFLLLLLPGGLVAQLLELPAVGENDIVIQHEGWSALYSEPHELARWVAYHLTAEELATDRPRTDNYRADPLVGTGSATPEDYAGMGWVYHRGHLAPAEDFQWSADAMSETFYMTNIAPQDPSFNLGVWKRLENSVRSWAKSERSLYVVTGPILNEPVKHWLGDNRVAVPARFFKAIVDLSGETKKAIAFLIPNTGSNLPLIAFAMTIDSLELITGLDLFAALGDDLEARLESQIDLLAWEW